MINNKRTISLTTKIVAILVLLGFLVALSCGIVGYARFTSVITQRYSEETSRIGNIIVDFIKASRIENAFDKLLSIDDESELKAFEKETVYDSSYSELVRFLDDLRRNTGVTNAFVAGFRDADGVISESGYYFAGVSGRRLDPEIAVIGESILLEGSLDVISQIYETGQTPDIQQMAQTEYGPVMNAYIPVIRKEQVVGIVGVQENMNTLIEARNGYLVNVAFYSTATTLAVIVLFIWLNKRILERPLKTITNAVSGFSTNHNALSQQLGSIKTNDELELLAATFIQMEKEINDYIENLASVTAEKERVQTELNLARDIQREMLPNIFPPFPERREFSIFATMEPAREVGGDFYDFFLIDEDHLGFVIADVSGKGVPAALFMVIAKTLIQDHAKLGLSPAQVFTNVNEILCQNNGAELFVTAWFGILDLKSGKLTFVNAGHNPPLLKRKDGSYEFLKKRSGLILAGLEGIKYRQFELDLEPGDQLFLYTDGVTEAQDLQRTLYGDQRLLETLNENRQAGVTEILEIVRADIEEFVDGAEQFDDITMLSIKLNQSGENDAD